MEQDDLFGFDKQPEKKPKRAAKQTPDAETTDEQAPVVVAEDEVHADTSDAIFGGQNQSLKELIDKNFLIYASYVIRDRAIPKLEDGLKPVQRRILHSLHENDDGKFIKVANIVGYCMQFHPHGDASIADALVVLANKRYLIERQGNFGNVLTGDRAAASRYIECRLTDLARNEIFNDELTQFVPSYDGRNKEPVALTSKLPLLLMLGAEGIAVGLSTRIFPHNFIELLEAEIAVLQKNRFTLLPDFIQGGLIDVAGYDDGVGKIKVRARMEKRDKSTLVIREVAFGTTTESLINSIEDAAKKGKIKIKSINDFTAEKIEIEVKFSSSETAEKVEAALYAFTDCEVSVSSRLISIVGNRPVEMTVTEVVTYTAKKLAADLKKELLLAEEKLERELHQKTLVQIFVENRIYKHIEECKTNDTVVQAVFDGFKPFAKGLRRELVREDVDMLLGIRIRRISLFDMNKHNQDMEKILAELEEVRKNLKRVTRYAISYLRGLIRKYKTEYPRMTKVSEFKHVDVKTISATSLAIKYDPEKGYIGTGVKGDTHLTCTNFDKIVVVWNDGSYKVMTPPEKLFVDKNMLYCAVADKKKILSVVYTADRVTYMKRFALGGFIMNKEYTCATDGAAVRFFADDDPAELYVKYKPAKGQRIHQQLFNLHDIPVKGSKAKGNQMTVKRIAKLSTTKPRNWDDSGPAGAMI